MNLTHVITATDHIGLFSALSIALVSVAITAFFTVMLLVTSERIVRIAAFTSIAVLACGGVAGGLAAHAEITRTNNLTRGVVTYVHDHNKLTAMNPIHLDTNDHGATFDAARADGSTVHVHITWNTGQPADGTPAPAGYNPITINVTP